MLEGKLDGHVFGADQPCFGCGPRHPIGFRLAFERDGDAVVTRFTPTEQYQGAPGLMHGGLASLLVDEIAAWAILSAKGKFGFTTSLNVRFHGPLRVNREIVGRGWIVKDARRLVDTQAELIQDGVRAISADLRFAVLDKKGAEGLLGSELPADWLRFTR
jgi:acyl-coenzyme A thioesterase PaaI-like protein